MKKGIWYAVGAYGAWGLFPIYWKWLQQVPVLQLLSHRITWSFFTLLFVIILLRRWKEFCSSVFNKRVLLIYSGAAILIGVNWLTFVWAVNAGFIIETSLGYFINPLFSVSLGVIFLRERLRIWQWLPIGLAATGVLFLTYVYGSLPWIALTLAFSFGLYGLVKKKAPLGSINGLTLETGILLLPAVMFLIYSDSIDRGAFFHIDLFSHILLIGAGTVTTVPLLLFASATQRIPLSLIGILQYIAPTMQFLVGVFIYKESFTFTHFIGYGIVWIALIIFAVESYVAYRSQSVVGVIE